MRSEETNTLFRDRTEAGDRLAERLKKMSLVNPLILAIPRGGVETGAAIAKKLSAELDVMVARKLQSPWNSELAIGAIAEHGRIYLNSLGKKLKKENPNYLEQEIQRQSTEIKRRLLKIRLDYPELDRSQRTLILTDDGIATGSTFFAALEVLRAEHSQQIIAAVPVLPKEQIKPLKERCDLAIYLESPSIFDSVGQFYENFSQVEFDEVTRLLGQVRSQIRERQPVFTEKG